MYGVIPSKRKLGYGSKICNMLIEKMIDMGYEEIIIACNNDDILFGENWNDDSIDLKTRCIVTVVALMSSGITDNSLRYHLENAKKNGVTKKEMVGIITHTAFYVGWPKAWAVFNIAKEVYKNE